ncbi:MAG: ectoine synthase [Thermoleophilia bacterium]|nr:ectoine synthase [Thermoleophilia bacterium]
MIVRSVEQIMGTEAEVSTPNWTSRRLLLQQDGMGFSFHETIIHAGTETHMRYLNHLEAVYCIEGDGEVETVEDGKIYAVRAGTIYALDRHDHHILRAKTDMRMACVFNPPCTGQEVHDENGAYPLEEVQENPV